MTGKRNIFVGLIVILGWGVWDPVAMGQNIPPPGPPSSTMTLVQDPLKRALSMVNKMQEEYYQEKLSTDEEGAQILRQLKDPFVSQLPPPEAPQQKDAAPTAAVVRKDNKMIAVMTPTPVPVKPNFKIAGFVWDTQNPQAIINGIIVGRGESLDGWEIKVINKEGVHVEKNGYQYWLKP